MNKLKIAAVMLAGAALTVSAEEHFKSLNPAYFDLSMPAGTDFYTRVNKGWEESHPLDAEHARYGQFNILTDSSEARVKRIITNLAATNPEPGTVAFKVSTIYNQALDSVRRNKEGYEPIKADLQRIEKARHDEMDDLFLWMHGNYASPFFGAGPMEDLADSKVYAMYISGGGMGLGDRDYYLANDKRNKDVREAYKKLIVNQMVNAGYSKKDARRIMKMS